MKLIYYSNRFRFLSHPVFSRVFRVSLYSTQTLTSSPSKDTLFRRISPVGDPRVSIVPVLDKWIEEGKQVERRDLRIMIKSLKLYKRFSHALQLSEWMSNRRYIPLSPWDMMNRLELISKVNGLEQAEKYFDNIPKKLRVFPIYNALLNCYVNKKAIEKAENLVHKMEELGFARSSLAYNALLNLFYQVGQHEKLDTLMEEMKAKGICYDKFTFCIRLSAYVATSDVKGIVKIMNMMEADPNVIMDWKCYSIAANGYIKAGLFDKALEMLKKSEGLVTGKTRRVAYEYFLTLYAGTGRKDEVYRIWNLYKSSEKLYNSAYFCMTNSLLKLDDIEGTEKILDEWESGGTTYDFRIPNLLIAAYCKKGLLEKAETFINKVVEKGKKPLASTWDSLATGYVKDNQILKAVETMKKAILASRPGWQPNRDTLADCLDYMKVQGDVEGAKEFVRILGAPGPFSVDVCERLLNYIGDGKLESSIVNEIDGDGLDDHELTNIESWNQEPRAAKITKKAI